MRLLYCFDIVFIFHSSLVLTVYMNKGVSRYGDEAVILAEEVCKSGKILVSDLLLQVYKNLSQESEQEAENPLASLSRLEKEVKRLILDKILVCCSPGDSSPGEAEVPAQVQDEKLMFSPPSINLKVNNINLFCICNFV